MMPKNMVYLLFHVLYLFNIMFNSYSVHICPWPDSQAKPYTGQFMLLEAYRYFLLNYYECF
jgi:hypothetical protein